MTSSFSYFLQGGQVTLNAAFDVLDVPTDPTTVTFRVRLPSNALVSYVFPDPGISHPAAGEFECTFDVDTPGRYRCRVEGTGACKAASELAFDVTTSDVL